MDLITEFAETFPVPWLCFLALLGAIVGSFLNVVIYRLPVMLERRWNDQAQRQLNIQATVTLPRYDLLLPRSACPHCQHPIAAIDTIPLLSWLLLRRKARCCQAPISWQYPFVESMMAALFVLSGWLQPVGIPLLGTLIFMAFILTLAVIDINKILLPDVLTLPMLWLGILFNLSESFVTLSQAVIGAMAGYLALWIVFWLFRLVTGKEALGYGDFKFLAALGAWLGWQMLPNLVLIAALSGLIFSLLRHCLTQKKYDQPLAFGPWLALGGLVSLICLRL